MHDPYMMKAVEYLTGVCFLLLFVAFWRFVNVEPVAAPLRALASQFADWFRVPDGLLFHHGHGWARAEAPGVMTVGLDDFAQQLVGPLAAVELPQPGTALRAGHRAWSLRAGEKRVDMLSPVSGTVLAVNDEVSGRAELANEDPYGRGWLMKVQVPRDSRLKDLLSGAAARRWMAKVAEELTASLTPGLGALAQDGGLPVHGIARGMDEEHWDEIARRFLHS